jgi:hypothetical protein
LGIKRKIAKKLPPRSPLGRTIDLSNPQFSSRLVDTISVYECFWLHFEVIDKYEQIIKVDEWHKGKDLQDDQKCHTSRKTIEHDRT